MRHPIRNETPNILIHTWHDRTHRHTYVTTPSGTPSNGPYVTPLGVPTSNPIYGWGSTVMNPTAADMSRLSQNQCSSWLTWNRESILTWCPHFQIAYTRQAKDCVRTLILRAQDEVVCDACTEFVTHKTYGLWVVTRTRDKQKIASALWNCADTSPKNVHLRMNCILIFCLHFQIAYMRHSYVPHSYKMCLIHVCLICIHL